MLERTFDSATRLNSPETSDRLANGHAPSAPPDSLAYTDAFSQRHIGITESDAAEMLKQLGFKNLEDLISATVPAAIRLRRPLRLDTGKTEFEALAELKEIAQQNQIYRSFIGMGYHNTITPPVIQRNILENPGWYTQYTPYQPEIAQGRLEALLNFQTMVTDLTGLEIANASLLDEATAAAEAMTMSYGLSKTKSNAFWVSDTCHPQTIAVVQTRARALGIEVILGDHRQFEFDRPVFGVLLQYPATDGVIYDYHEFCDRAHTAGAIVTVAADLLSLTLLKPPGRIWGGCGDRQHPALRRAPRLRRPPRRLLRHKGSLQAPDSRPASGSLEGCPRSARPATGPTNPRTAHPPRQSHEQHLHCPSAAGHHRQYVCRLSRSRGPAPDCRAGASPHRHSGRRTATPRLLCRHRTLLRYAAGGSLNRASPENSAAIALPSGEPAPDRRSYLRHLPRRNHWLRRPNHPVPTVRRQPHHSLHPRRPPPPLSHSPTPPTPSAAPPPTLPIPSFTPTTPKPNCCATCIG